VYSTCIFCHTSLGSNEAVEHFPIGRRLAFDAALGRLWAVCRKCERWNLSPLDERWEAIEECERLFAGTRLRVSTDNIGLARVADGLELVRVGSPQRPEMAAWRYGDQFGRRRIKHLAYTGVGVAAITGLFVLGPMTGIVAGGIYPLVNLANTANTLLRQRRIRAQLPVAGRAQPIRLRQKQLAGVSLVRMDGGWALRVPARDAETEPLRLSNGRALQVSRLTTEGAVMITGEDALRAAAMLLPAVNASGATKRKVQAAVHVIEQTPDAAALMERYASRTPPPQKLRPVVAPGFPLVRLPKEIALALEMATHEDAERRALEGELALLEDAWRQAEEVASISDDMFVPDAVTARLDELKRLDGR
jgi:hypothetical protein